MKQLGGRIARVIGGDLKDIAGVLIDGHADVTVRVDDALRPPRRPGAVQPERHVLAVRVGRRGQFPGAPALARDGVEARVRPRVTVDHEHVQAESRLELRLEPGEQRCLDDEHARVAVVEVVDVVVDPVHRVDRHGDGADPHRPEEGGGECRRVVEDHQHALLALDAEVDQVGGDRGRQGGQLAVGDRSVGGQERWLYRRGPRRGCDLAAWPRSVAPLRSRCDRV